jgi:hypothetical protein
LPEQPECFLLLWRDFVAESQLLVETGHDADAEKIMGTTASYENHLDRVVVDHVLE